MLFLPSAWGCFCCWPIRAAEPPSYTLGEDSGKLALFKTGENTPVTRYEIYTGLLPEQDVAALQQGIPVATQKELRRYLEDFGA